MPGKGSFWKSAVAKFITQESGARLLRISETSDPGVA
jgi:hypothetical protein